MKQVFCSTEFYANFTLSIHAIYINIHYLTITQASHYFCFRTLSKVFYTYACIYTYIWGMEENAYIHIFPVTHEVHFLNKALNNHKKFVLDRKMVLTQIISHQVYSKWSNSSSKIYYNPNLLLKSLLLTWQMFVAYVSTVSKMLNISAVSLLQVLWPTWQKTDTQNDSHSTANYKGLKYYLIGLLSVENSI